MRIEDRLRQWADARDRRLAENHPTGAHGVTGTALLREAADEIEKLGRAIEGESAAYQAGYESAMRDVEADGHLVDEPRYPHPYE